MAVTLRYLTEFGKPVFQTHKGVIYASLLYFVVRVLYVVVKKV